MSDEKQGVYDGAESIEAFVAAAAAKQPTPGGGSVTALVGALSAAMGEMVLNYSVGKKDLGAHEPVLREVLAEFTRARQMLLQLMVEDQAAYDALTRIRKEGGRADPRFNAALLACLRIPQAVAATAVAILELLDRTGDKVNPYLTSDYAVCCELAMATTRCALYNVRVNLADLSAQERRPFELADARIHTHATGLIQRVLPRIWSNRPKTR